jgi:hypothetical protein
MVREMVEKSQTAIWVNPLDSIIIIPSWIHSLPYRTSKTLPLSFRAFHLLTDGNGRILQIMDPSTGVGHAYGCAISQHQTSVEPASLSRSQLKVKVRSLYVASSPRIIFAAA